MENGSLLKRYIEMSKPSSNPVSESVVEELPEDYSTEKVVEVKKSTKF